MMPIVFCASLPPCPSEYSEAETNCRMRKARSTANGVERTDAQDTIATSTIASKNPTSGDSTMASNVLDSPLQTAAEIPALAIPPPTSPPISACELEDGIPNPQVIRFQTIAPTNAAKITCAVDDAGLDDAGADGLGDMKPEHQEGDEIEERRPQHGVLRPQHSGRDDRRDRIGGVVQSVEEVEQQRDCDQSDQNRKTKRGIHCAALPYTCSITMLLISLATSSKRSATFSRWS